MLREATRDLCWLLDRGYPSPSTLKLVGDRYGLLKRQRTAVARCACSDESKKRRQAKLVDPQQPHQQQLWIDGYNVLTTLEAAMGHAVLLVACDGCFRDMASMHGSYRKVAETVPALELLGETVSVWNVARLHWRLDSPVSNSGRLKGIILDVAQQHGWNWTVELVQNPDSVLAASENIVATADSAILDQCQQWINLARIIVEQRIPHAVVVDLSK
jgi:hypothetical protein